MNERAALALDLGGTNVRVVAVTESGEILSRQHSSTTLRSAGAIYDQIAGLAKKCVDEAGERSISAFAAAVPTTNIDENGVLGKLPNIPELENTNLARELHERLGLEVYPLNDASAATLGENWLGASKGVENVVGVTLGTGVGGGLILDGDLYLGSGGGAGEIGHIRIVPNGRPCGCGRRGCLEQYSSGTAVARFAKEEGLEAETPKDVFDLASSGDSIAQKIFSEMGRRLGIGLSIANDLLSPEIFVIGGGVAAAWDQFYEPLAASVRENSLPDRGTRVKIIRASLGEDAGVLGAAKFVFQKL